MGVTVQGGHRNGASKYLGHAGEVHMYSKNQDNAFHIDSKYLCVTLFENTSATLHYLREVRI